MPIIAKASGTSVPAPEGTHTAICVDVVDLGVLEVTYSGKTSKQHKIKIVWQIDEDRDDGQPYQVNKRYTLSLHDKATLRKDLESWRGRAFTDAELDGFDVEAVMGVGCLLNIIHNKGHAGGIFANVAGVMKLPKGSPTIKMRDYVRVVDRTPEAQAQANSLEIDDSDIPF